MPARDFAQCPRKNHPLSRRNAEHRAAYDDIYVLCDCGMGMLQAACDQLRKTPRGPHYSFFEGSDFAKRDELRPFSDRFFGSTV